MIFCVEDDDSIRELMVYALTSSGFKATGFADGAFDRDREFRALVQTDAPQ